MPKRGKSSDYYRRKKKKLEREEERRHRPSIFPVLSSDSDDDISASSDSAPNLEVDAVVEVHSRNDAPAAEASGSNQESTSYPELNTEFLKALGDEIKNTSKFGEKIHHTLPGRWEPILMQGLSQEQKEKLINEYLVPENCTLLQAPLLNNEIAEIIPETQRFRDNKKEAKQQQLGAGISAITKALTLLLTNGKRVDAIKIIGDSCRILSDLHFQETQIRIKTINYSLDEPCLHLVLGTKRDDTLYGNNITKKIKDSRLSIKRCKNQTKVLHQGNQRSQVLAHSTTIVSPTRTRKTGQDPQASKRTRGGGEARAEYITPQPVGLQYNIRRLQPAQTERGRL